MTGWVWDQMDLYERRNYLAERHAKPMNEKTLPRTTVSNAEIWAECFGRNPAEMKPADSYAIAALMIQIDEWERGNKRIRIPLYGLQRVYRKTGPTH